MIIPKGFGAFFINLLTLNQKLGALAGTLNKQQETLVRMQIAIAKQSELLKATLKTIPNLIELEIRRHAATFKDSSS